MNGITSFKRIVLLATLLALTACGGGGGGGGGGGSGGPTPLATGTFTKTVDGVDTGLNRFPFTDINSSQILQQLYLASEINGAGFINRLSFRYDLDLASAVDCPNTTVKLGHTSLTSLTTTFASNVEQGKGSQVTVINDATITIPAGTGGNYFDVPLDNSFHYNGVDNLVVEFVRNAACTGEVKIDSMTATARQANIQPIAATGLVGDILRFTKFNFAGGDNEQNFGGVDGNTFPFSSSTPRTQNLYLASEIDGSGPITGFAFQMNEVSTAQTYTATITMGHSTLATLGIDFAANYSDTPVTVANEVTFNIPAGIPAGEWFWVPLPDGTFSYNGTDNFIVDVTVSAGTGTTNLRVAQTIVGRRVANADHTATTAVVVDNNTYHVKLRFNGGTMDVVSPSPRIISEADSVPFNDTLNHISQHLYGAYDLGTAGKIDSLALRLALDSVAEEYTGVTVRMGHTANTGLDITLANNMDDPTTVFTGSLNIPAGLKAGDWFEFPVSGFSYDPTKNLVVEITINAGTGSNFNLIRYNLGGAIAAIGVAFLGGTDFFGTEPAHAELRLGIAK